MSRPEEFKCPSCGATKSSQIDERSYQCDYCGSQFMAKEQPVIEVYYQDEIRSEAPKPKNSGCGIIIFIVVLLVVILAWVISVSKKRAAYQAPPRIEASRCLLGSKGPVVWQILDKPSENNDNYSLRLIDPVTKKILAEKKLAQSNFDNDFYAHNDTVYNVNIFGLAAFDLYTGKELFNFEYFQKKFPLLKIGYPTATSDYENARIKISLANGTDMYYYFESGVLLKEKDYEARYANSSFEKNVCLSQDQEPRLYECNQKKSAKTEYSIPGEIIEQFSKKRSFRTPDIKSIKLLSNALYPAAKPLAKYNNQLVFLYASDFSNNPEGILALADKKGKIIIKNTDALFKKYVKMSASFINHQLKNDLIVIYSYPEKNSQSIGVDLKTGKTLFIFNNEAINTQ